MVLSFAIFEAKAGYVQTGFSVVSVHPQCVSGFGPWSCFLLSILILAAPACLVASDHILLYTVLWAGLDIN